MTEHILFLSVPFAFLIIVSVAEARVFHEFFFAFLLILQNIHEYVVVVMVSDCLNCLYRYPNRIDFWNGFGFELEVGVFFGLSVRLFLFQFVVE